MEKAKRNEIVDMESEAVFKVDNSKLKIVIQGNTEKIPLSVWLETHFPSMASKESDLLDLENHLTSFAASLCIGIVLYFIHLSFSQCRKQFWV